MPKPQIVFTPEAWDWMRGYTLAVKTEIGGFGYVYSPEKSLFIVDTIMLAPQEVSGAGVHFKDGAMGFMVEQAIKDDRINEARFSWHSHNTMNVYWSSTDEEGIQDYKNTGMPWLVSAVTNHKGEVKCRIDIFDTCCNQITIQDTEVRVGLPDPQMTEYIEEDIARFVEEKKYYSTANNNNKSGGDKGKHRPAGQQTQPRQLPSGSSHHTSVDWWDEIDWHTISEEDLDELMRKHGFNIDAEVEDDDTKARQMAKIEAEA